jgi:rhodanese-related sulfurtransferase
VVTDRRDGTRIYYALADEGVVAFLRSLEELARGHMAEVERIVRQHFESLDELEPLDAAALRERMRTDDLVLLDVRPRDEYRAGHIPGAISIPAGELERRLAEIPPDREVVAYCRGPYCVLSLQAIAVLRDGGRAARRLTVGLPDWRALGYAVETDEAVEIGS